VVSATLPGRHGHGLPGRVRGRKVCHPEHAHAVFIRYQIDEDEGRLQAGEEELLCVLTCGSGGHGAKACHHAEAGGVCAPEEGPQEEKTAG